MADPLPTPARANGAAARALNPTEVIPGPQPVQRSDADAARVISGEVLGGPRHRGQRIRRPGPGSVGTAVLSATGAVAGLSLLMAHGGSPEAGAPAHQPLKAVAEDTAQVAPEAAAKAVSAVAKADGTQGATTTSVSTDNSGTSASTGTSASSSSSSTSATGTARHARTSGTWETGDWQEAVTRAAAAPRSGGGPDRTGHHRADTNSGQSWDRSSGAGGTQ
jgi:hypothetical protein